MSRSNFQSNEARIGCIVNFIGLFITATALVWQIITSRADMVALESHLNNQATQIALNVEDIGVGREQLAVAIAQLTVMAGLSDPQEQPIGTPSLDDKLIPTATALAEEASRLEATRQAIETRRSQIVATETSAAISITPVPTLTFDPSQEIKYFPGIFQSEPRIPIPPSTSMEIVVNDGEVHAVTAGTIEVAGISLPGGRDRVSVVILLPPATYSVTGLNPGWNWHGAFHLSEWKPLADVLAAQQRRPGACSDGAACSTIDILVVGPDGVICNTTDPAPPSVSCTR